jgi:hypothetical protein
MMQPRDKQSYQSMQLRYAKLLEDAAEGCKVILEDAAIYDPLRGHS